MAFLLSLLPPMLWVGGLALLLAGASYARYEGAAWRGGWLGAGAALVAGGAMLGAGALWERLGWGAVLLLLGLSALQRRRAP